MNWNALSKNRTFIYGFSILWIMVFHVYDKATTSEIADWVSTIIIRNGNIGVDIFLFLSAISLYFAMKKMEEKGEASLWAFYKKRFAKVLPVYVFLCLPFLYFERIIGQHSWKYVFLNATGLNEHVSRYWYVFCILVCYLIYPFYYRLIVSGKKKVAWGILIGYALAMLVWCYIDQESFMYSEVALTRIPVFLLGALMGEKVYNKETIHPAVLLTFIVLMFFREPTKKMLTLLPYLNRIVVPLNRYYMGVIGIGMIFSLCIIAPLLKGSVIEKAISWCGKYTLEMYVIHVFLSSQYFIRYHRTAAFESILDFAILVVAITVVTAPLAAKSISILLDKLKPTRT